MHGSDLSATCSNFNSFPWYLNLLLSYSIPVILRQGAKLPEVEIKSIELISGKDKKATVSFRLNGRLKY